MKLTEKLHFQETLKLLLENHIKLVEQFSVTLEQTRTKKIIQNAETVKKISDDQVGILKKELLKVCE